MNIGDTLICKKNYDTYYTKNKSYSIEQIDEQDINFITYQINGILLNQIHKYNKYFIWNYFYTPEEIKTPELIRIIRNEKINSL